MNQRPSLREALARADVAELDEVAGEVGRQAIITALAEVAETPPPRRYEPTDEEERQRLLDAALADAIDAGYPSLLEAAHRDGPEGLEELERFRLRALNYLPAAA